jgi:hypothetical protein
LRPLLSSQRNSAYVAILGFPDATYLVTVQ